MIEQVHYVSDGFLINLGAVLLQLCRLIKNRRHILLRYSNDNGVHIADLHKDYPQKKHRKVPNRNFTISPPNWPTARWNSALKQFTVKCCRWARISAGCKTRIDSKQSDQTSVCRSDPRTNWHHYVQLPVSRYFNLYFTSIIWIDQQLFFLIYDRARRHFRKEIQLLQTVHVHGHEISLEFETSPTSIHVIIEIINISFVFLNNYDYPLGCWPPTWKPIWKLLIRLCFCILSFYSWTTPFICWTKDCRTWPNRTATSSERGHLSTHNDAVHVSQLDQPGKYPDSGQDEGGN